MPSRSVVVFDYFSVLKDGKTMVSEDGQHHIYSERAQAEAARERLCADALGAVKIYGAQLDDRCALTPLVHRSEL